MNRLEQARGSARVSDQAHLAKMPLERVQSKEVALQASMWVWSVPLVKAMMLNTRQRLGPGSHSCVMLGVERRDDEKGRVDIDGAR